MSWEQQRENRKRNMSLELDLNRDPPTEEGGTSIQQQQQQQPPQTPTPVVNVADDDDVIESSPRSFAQAKRIAEESRRVRRRTNIVNVDLENGTSVDPQNQTTTNENHGNVEIRSSSVQSANPIPEPPKEPVFNCPICMAPLVEETSTRCGHIFCKTCIRAAVSSQGKCPTCRKKVSRNSLIRVFLPAAS